MLNWISTYTPCIVQQIWYTELMFFLHTSIIYAKWHQNWLDMWTNGKEVLENDKALFYLPVWFRCIQTVTKCAIFSLYLIFWRINCLLSATFLYKPGSLCQLWFPQQFNLTFLCLTCSISNMPQLTLWLLACHPTPVLVHAVTTRLTSTWKSWRPKRRRYVCFYITNNEVILKWPKSWCECTFVAFISCFPSELWRCWLGSGKASGL